MPWPRPCSPSTSADKDRRLSRRRSAVSRFLCNPCDALTRTPSALTLRRRPKAKLRPSGRRSDIGRVAAYRLMGDRHGPAARPSTNRGQTHMAAALNVGNRVRLKDVHRYLHLHPAGSLGTIVAILKMPDIGPAKAYLVNMDTGAGAFPEQPLRFGAVELEPAPAEPSLN
jgi:hypothetical protein